jgi:N-ethylmaleimide reductase
LRNRKKRSNEATKQRSNEATKQRDEDATSNAVTQIDPHHTTTSSFKPHRIAMGPPEKFFNPNSAKGIPMSTTPNLFSPIHLGAYELKNRVFMAPLTRLRAGAEGVPTELNAEYYAQRSGAGLIISEGTYPTTMGRGYIGQPGLATAKQVAGWRKVTDAVHRAGSRIFTQVHHAGRVSHPSLLPFNMTPVAPSAVQQKGEVHTAAGKVPYVTPRALETFEIPQIVEQFRIATINAFEAGFDGVELHNANGYLPHTFISSVTNRRSDQYGGSVENRLRFTLELIDAMSSVRGPEYVGIKISPGTFNFHDMSDGDPENIYPALARELSKRKIAYMHVQRTLTTWGEQPPAFDAVAIIRESFKTGLTIAGGEFDKSTGNAAIESRALDAVVFGRGFIANPDLVERLRVDAPLQSSTPDTWYGIEGNYAKGYTDHPTLEKIRA